MPRRLGPATLLRSEVEGSNWRIDVDAIDPRRLLHDGVEWLVVAYGDEIVEDLVADVGPSLDYFLGRRPILVADLRCVRRGFGRRASVL